MNTRLLIGLLIALAILVGGYFTYDYLREKPPSWLIELVTKTEPPPPLPEGDSAPLIVPQGFKATIFARGVEGARVMTFDPKGTMLVSQTSAGKVVALPNRDTDLKADRIVTVLEGLKQPHGMLVLCPYTGNESADQDACVLYVAETGALKSYAYDADTYTATYKETIATFPTGPGHFTRTLMQHPDGRLLVSVGSSCNVCEETSPLRATVQVIDLATNAMTTFASGLRNTVFMATHPVTGEVWGSDHGRDLLGDDTPPDEINILRAGGNYGWPICYGQNVHDTDFDTKQYIQDPCTGKAPAHIEIPAHSAVLGIAFVPEEGWPEDMWHDLIVAEHGSWNRSTPAGYKVVRIDLDPNGTPNGETHDFVTGFLPNGSTDTDDAIGRPVDVLLQPGGLMYLSDDRAGAIYRISLTEPAM